MSVRETAATVPGLVFTLPCHFSMSLEFYTIEGGEELGEFTLHNISEADVKLLSNGRFAYR